SHTPKITPNIGVMNEKTPRREARYFRSSQNQVRKVMNETTMPWNRTLPMASGVGLTLAWPETTAAKSNNTNAPISWYISVMVAGVFDSFEQRITTVVAPQAAPASKPRKSPHNMSAA